MRPLTHQEETLKKDVETLLNENYPVTDHITPASQAYRQQILGCLAQLCDETPVADRKPIKLLLEGYLRELRGEDDDTSPPPATSAAPSSVTGTITTKTTIKEVVQITTKVTEDQDTARRMAFGLFLKSLKDEIKSRKLDPKPTCFISYAWEVDPQENSELQERLKLLRGDLSIVKVKVLLDISDMDRNMENYMKDNIAQCDNILFIGTPRFKERASNPATYLGLEVSEALKKPASTLVPLWYKGANFWDAFPDTISKSLIRDFRNYDDYLSIMTRVDSPMGLIPSLFKLRNDREYETLLEGFMQDLKLIASNSLSIEELNRRNMRFEATKSAHQGSTSAPQIVTPVSQPQPQSLQEIKTTLASNVELEIKSDFNVKGFNVGGVSVQLDSIQDNSNVEVVHKGLKSIIDSNKTTMGFNKMKVAQEAKVDATGAGVQGVNFKYDFAPAPTATLAPPSAPGGGAKTSPRLKATRKDIELMDSVKKTLAKAFVGAASAHQAALQYLEQFENRLLKPADKQQLLRYQHDKEGLIQLRGLMEKEYGDDVGNNLVAVYEAYGSPSNLLSEEDKQGLHDMITDMGGTVVPLASSS